MSTPSASEPATDRWQPKNLHDDRIFKGRKKVCQQKVFRFLQEEPLFTAPAAEERQDVSGVLGRGRQQGRGDVAEMRLQKTSRIVHWPRAS